jgi:IclR family transcriptional regulator, pca regulon regulatory protein
MIQLQSLDNAASASQTSDFSHRDLIASLERGFRVLRAFDQDSVEMTPSDVARKTGMPRAATRRVLLTLCDLGYAITDGKHFRLTPKVLDLAHGYLAKTRIRQAIAPIMRDTVSAINDTCILAIRDGTDSIAVGCWNATSFGAVNVNLGLRVPLYVSTPGRLILADLPPRQFAEYLETVTLQKFTSHTVISKQSLIEQIAIIREQGYALGREEFELGVYALSVPVKSPAGRTLAALTAVGNVARVQSAESVEHRIAVLRATAVSLHRSLPDTPDFTADLQLSMDT